METLGGDGADLGGGLRGANAAATRGSGIPLRRTSKSLEKLSAELRVQGHAMNPNTVAVLLRDQGYSPERSPVFGNGNGSAVIGPEFFAPKRCRARGDRPRRVSAPRAGPLWGPG